MFIRRQSRFMVAGKNEAFKKGGEPSPPESSLREKPLDELAEGKETQARAEKCKSWREKGKKKGEASFLIGTLPPYAGHQKNRGVVRKKKVCLCVQVGIVSFSESRRGSHNKEGRVLLPGECEGLLSLRKNSSKGVPFIGVRVSPRNPTSREEIFPRGPASSKFPFLFGK